MDNRRAMAPNEDKALNNDGTEDTFSDTERRLRNRIAALEAENKRLNGLVIQAAAEVVKLRSFEDDDPMDEKIRLLAIKIADSRIQEKGE